MRRLEPWERPDFVEVFACREVNQAEFKHETGGHQCMRRHAWSEVRLPRHLWAVQTAAKILVLQLRIS
jgi:hypothetical protein